MQSEYPQLDVIAVGAHPDDVEIACGGTLASLADRGYQVGIIDLTDGEPTPGCPNPAVRLEEARKAAGILGAQRITLELPNRRLFDCFEARVALAIDVRILLPIILIAACLGVYATTRQVFDIGLMFAFGLFGYFMRRVGISPLPMLIAFLLGPLLEDGVRRAMIMSGGSPIIFFERPISLVFVALATLTLLGIVWRSVRPAR